MFTNIQELNDYDMLLEIRQYLAQLSDFLSEKEFYNDSDACAEYCYVMDEILGTPPYKEWKSFQSKLFDRKRQLEEKDYKSKEALRKVKEVFTNLKNM
tara:strand:- start:1039 stop:1332 length:294 start_codon:yes stop_codon:yes gene_type:complete